MKQQIFALGFLALALSGCGENKVTTVRPVVSELTGAWKTNCVAVQGGVSSSTSEMIFNNDATITSIDTTYDNATCEGTPSAPETTTMDYTYTQRTTTPNQPDKIYVKLSNFVESKPNQSDTKADSTTMEIVLGSKTEITMKAVAAMITSKGETGSHSVSEKDLAAAPSITLTRK